MQELPLARIKKIMKLDEDVKVRGQLKTFAILRNLLLLLMRSMVRDNIVPVQFLKLKLKIKSTTSLTETRTAYDNFVTSWIVICFLLCVKLKRLLSFLFSV